MSIYEYMILCLMNRYTMQIFSLAAGYDKTGRNLSTAGMYYPLLFARKRR